MQQVSPSDSEHSFDWQRSSFSSSRSSFSTQASAISPTMKDAGFLATPTTPSAFPQPTRHVPLHPIAPGAVPPSPPLQAISTLAAFAGELFVWLWFAPPRQGDTAAVKASKQQLQPSERFLRFTHDLLSTSELPRVLFPDGRVRELTIPLGLGAHFPTAQVSHSVVILALLFISRLKSKNDINGSPGSEFRSSVTALMMANKVLDDNSERLCMTLHPTSALIFVYTSLHRQNLGRRFGARAGGFLGEGLLGARFAVLTPPQLPLETPRRGRS